VPTQLAFRTVAVVALFAFIAGCLAAVAGAQTPVAPPATQPSVVATGTGSAKVTPKDRTSDKSIQAAVDRAQATSLPLAFTDAKTQAGQLAAQAGVGLGALVTIANGPGQLFYGPYGTTGTFGPGLWCGNVRTRSVTVGKDGKRHYGKYRTKRTCRFPGSVTRQVTLTYAIA
jgi:uncharacterized protein YggE